MEKLLKCHVCLIFKIMTAIVIETAILVFHPYINQVLREAIAESITAQAFPS